MKKLPLLVWLSVFIFYSCESDETENKVVVSFENLLSERNTTFVTDKGVVDPTNSYGIYKYQFKDPQSITEFNHYYWEGGSFGGGFTYTNTTDINTPGYSNLSAITAKGVNGLVYFTAKTDQNTPAQITNLQPDKYHFKGAWVTNCTYAYLAIKDGNDGYLNQTKFENNDWFKVRATGYDPKGSSIGYVDFYLADYRNGKKEIIDTWKWFDWSSISRAYYIKFEMSSTDNNDKQEMNTPSYFCLDGITLIED